jgi:probable addiction module antidote protein
MKESITMREFDAACYLDDEETMAEYLAACLEDPNPDVFLAALGDVAKARGIARLAKDTGLGRESLYKTFSPGKKPHFETILKITKAMGVSLSIKPHKAGKRRHHATA